MKRHWFCWFIDNLYPINDGNEFLTSSKNIYSKELEFKVEHHGKHLSFLDVDTKIEDGVSLTKETNFHSL